MTSLDKAMKMLLVAQNIIHEQEAKIKLLKYKHRKMKSKIYSLEQFIETAPLIKTERTHRKKEKSTQTTNEDGSERNESLDAKCSSTVPLCDLVEKLELNTQPNERQSPATTLKDAICQTIRKTENKSPIKQSQFGALKRTTSNNTIDSKESIQIITKINSIETDYTTNIDKTALNEKFVSKVIENIKQESNLDSFESVEEESGFNLENFLHGNEESNDNSITSSIFSNETEQQDGNTQKSVPPFDDTIRESENLLTNEFILNSSETQSTGSKFFFHNGEPDTIPFTDLDDSEGSSQNPDNIIFNKFPAKILDKPLGYLNDEHSSQANDSCVNDVVNFPSLVETNNSKSCDILADYSQTNYNMVNFELLENLSESQIDTMELFNDQELNSTLNLSEISNHNKVVESTDCHIEHSGSLLSPVLESELVKSSSELSKNKNKNTRIKKTTVKKKCKQKTRMNTRKCKMLGSGNSGYTSHDGPISDNILNVRSVFNEDTPEEIISTEITQQTEQIQTSTQDQANELIRIVEENQVEFFATDDKDTFIISLNSDMDPNRIKQLLNDGTLSIHVDDGYKQHTTENITEEDYRNGIDGQSIEDTSLIISKSTDEGWNDLDSDDCKSKDDVIIFISDRNSTNNTNIIQSGNNISESQILNISDSNHIYRSGISIEQKQNGGNAVLNLKSIDKDDFPNLKNRNSFTCQMCKKIFHKKDNFKSHMATHNKKKKRHVCESCGETFSWRSSLVRHTSSKHLPPTQCSLCPALFPDASKVKEHMANKHLKEKAHECTYPDCGRKFFKKYNLTLHIRTHTKEQPYACSICDTTFGHISHKTRHERTHFTPIPSHSQKIVRYKPPAATNSNNNVTSHT